MGSDFVKFQEYLKRLREIYFEALSSFCVYEALREIKAHNVVGEKEAEDNTEVINRFKNFFIVAEYAANFNFFMQLAKFFDDAKQSLHLEKLINFAKSNSGRLTASDFREVNQDREFLDELVRRYEGIKQEDLEVINNLLNSNSLAIKKLIDYRDQYLAHEDKNKEKIIITGEEVAELLQIVHKILDIFSSKTDFSTWQYDHLKDGCRNDTKLVIEYLKRYEKYRIQEINERYGTTEDI
ncbi:MAG: hypothetical protein Q8L47_00025 [bacterium]|nr:hypothetical protein [bacterium]